VFVTPPLKAGIMIILTEAGFSPEKNKFNSWISFAKCQTGIRASKKPTDRKTKSPAGKESFQ
jgi:hypothetical protein